jgi:hypothetical protein
MSTTVVGPTGTISVPVDPIEAQNQTSPAQEKMGKGTEPAKPKTEPRPYVVLRKNPVSSPASAQTWEFLRNIEATSQQQACRKAAEILLAAGEVGAITLVAVTAARFVPVTVTAEIKTQLKLT